MSDISLPVETDLYAVLGVGEKATDSQISKQFHKLAKQCHPDLHPNNRRAETEFKRISAAYEVLGDAKQRDRYDTERKLLARRAAEGSGVTTTSPYAGAPVPTAPSGNNPMQEAAVWVAAAEGRIQQFLRRVFYARLWIGGTMCLVGFVLIAGYAHTLFTGLTATRPTATATVVVDSSNKVRGANALEFITNSGKQVLTTLPRSLSNSEIGSLVDVRYSSAHPANAKLASDPTLGGLNVWGLAGLGLFGLGFLALPFHKYRMVRVRK